jgi:hypothetical protein
MEGEPPGRVCGPTKIGAELASRRSNPAGKQITGYDVEEGATGTTIKSSAEDRMVAELAAMK